MIVDEVEVLDGACIPPLVCLSWLDRRLSTSTHFAAIFPYIAASIGAAFAVCGGYVTVAPTTVKLGDVRISAIFP